MKAVDIAHLKSHLSRYLREVRAGAVLTVLDRKTPIARLTPIDSADDLVITPPSQRIASLAAIRLPSAAKIDVDVVAVLLDDRRKRG